MHKTVNSKGNAKAYINYLDNLLIPKNTIVPPIEIVSKIVKSNHIYDYDGKYHEELSGIKHFYTDLQSINSEDAITWSLFGYISKLDDRIRLDFFNEFLSKISLLQNDDYCEIKLWQRLPHPDTNVSGGPEIDVILIGKRNFIIIECKWNSKIAKKQGVSKNKDQMQIRQEWINKIGKVIYPNHNIELVYVSKEKDDKYKSITWDELSMFKSLPHKDEFIEYLKSKK
ncbi:hypothetical protein DIC82_11505 [Clostridium beijerinckii]|nr:hypothetical protein DIC82_11505 [Clostridium beijerinckii]